MQTYQIAITDSIFCKIGITNEYKKNIVIIKIIKTKEFKHLAIKLALRLKPPV